MIGRTVNPIQISIKMCFHASIIFIISGIGKAFQFKTGCLKNTQFSCPLALIFYAYPPNLVISILRHIQAPERCDLIHLRRQLCISQMMRAFEIFHFFIERCRTYIPTLHSLIITDINIACIIIIQHTHIRFLIQVITSSMPILGNLRTVAFLTPKIIKPIAWQFGLIDHAGFFIFRKFI